MAVMSNYCKAYLLKQLRAYPGWSENAANARKEKKDVDGKEVESTRQLDDESIVYVHDDYVVTDDVYRDENVLFENVTDEWKQFCHSDLAFEVPVWEPITIPTAESAAETPSGETANNG